MPLSWTAFLEDVRNKKRYQEKHADELEAPATSLINDKNNCRERNAQEDLQYAHQSSIAEKVGKPYKFNAATG